MVTVSRIKSGGKEPILFTAVDSGGDLVTGLSDIKIKIRRLSDGFFFDWSDDTFKIVTSVSLLLQELVPVSDVYSPGEYHLDQGISSSHEKGFDTSSITNPTVDEVYYVTVLQDVLSPTVANVPGFGEIRVGDFIDERVPLTL